MPSGVLGVKRVKTTRPYSEQKMLDDLREQAKRAGWVKIMRRVHEQFRRRHNAFNRPLSRYAFVPALAYRLDAGVWRFNKIPKRTRGRVVKMDDQTGIVRVDETTVVAALARLTARRELFKVRLCEQCRRRWRVSMREMDKFCSDECRASFHAHSEKGRLSHRKAQRKYLKSPGYRNAAK